MSGTQIIAELLRDTPAVVQLVPLAQIKAGALEDDAPMPSLFLRSVSEVERQTLRRVGVVRITERVEVMVRAANYRDAQAIRRLVRDTCAGRTGTLSDFPGCSILSAGAGPDIRGPNRSFEKSQDFRVSFETTA